MAHHCSSSYVEPVNFNVYLDDDLVRRLEALAKRKGSPRNAVIREAVSRWVNRAGVDWPELVLEWRGDPSTPRFEDARSELSAPSADPFVAEPPRKVRRRPRTRPRR